MKYCTICKTKYEDSVSFCPTDGEVLEDDPSSIVGTVLDGQYKIETLLGKGGMGAVYLARHILLGDRVAIKILPREVRTNAEWLRRFRREGQAARRFRHANAVTVYDLRTAADGNIYMVMEYVEGHTLDAEIKKRGPSTAAEAFEILEPIMSVLNTAHAMGVVHRDLKPENIMIGKATTGGEPTVKLLDLGIAKMREIAGVESSGTTELTMAGQVLGTPYYMSPEQWGELSRDGNLEIDGRADIYSLGLVVYEMIIGRRPYSAATLHELRRDHVSVVPPPLIEKAPGVPRAFSDAIARAIAKDRVDRPATAGELAAELRAALANAPQLPVDRTVADIRHVEGSTSHTHGIPGAVSTKSDVNAATIVTVDAPPTSPPSVPSPPRPAAAGREAEPVVLPQPAQRGAADMDLGSSATVPRRQPPMEIPLGQQKRGGKGLLIAGAILLLVVLAVVGVGGIFAFSWFKSKPGTGTATEKKPTSGPNPAVATSEFGRYWLETLPNEPVAEPVRVAGAVPLKSGQAFKFHFEFSANGYVYVIGPGEQNQPTAFLTEKPASISGLENNQVVKGDDFSFPSGLEHWLELDKKPGSENYTIIFSSERLSTPSFLTQQATGKPLADSEQTELRDFLAQHQTSTPVTELNNKDSAAPYVALKVPAAKNSGPVIFQVRIDHK
ncbi:MAG: eukaryotic-like serine/threonine-protein kinase [Pyrinomonadaceae bacterium]|jgi:serine/threonine-protein kinase|nr:eukaryotic-like serine/threonine-protein kinase [Pyrinomonadaceae bacterium]